MDWCQRAPVLLCGLAIAEGAGLAFGRRCRSGIVQASVESRPLVGLLLAQGGRRGVAFAVGGEPSESASAQNTDNRRHLQPHHRHQAFRMRQGMTRFCNGGSRAGKDRRYGLTNLGGLVSCGSDWHCRSGTARGRGQDDAHHGALQPGLLRPKVGGPIRSRNGAVRCAS